MFTKDFFKDKLVLFLGFLTVFLTIFNVALVLLQADFGQAKITFRHWLVNGNSQFEATEPSYLYAFIFVALIVLATSCLMSYKIYDHFRPGAYATFILSQIVLVANIFIAEILITL